MWGRKGFGAPQIWCLTAVMLATMESRLRLSGSMLGLCWAYVGPMLGYSDGWVGRRPPEGPPEGQPRQGLTLWRVPHRVHIKYRFCSFTIAFRTQNTLCRTNVGPFWLMLAFLQDLRPVWEEFCQYVGPDILIFVGRKCQGFGAPQIWCLTVLMLGLWAMILATRFILATQMHRNVLFSR